MTAPIESLDGCHYRHVANADGKDRDGKFFADIQQVVEHPRLQRTVTHWTKRTKQSTVTWYLDGTLVGDLDAALAALNAKPFPEISMTELEMIRQAGDEWTTLLGAAAFHYLAIRDKGLVEFNPEQRGQMRRTALARQMLGLE